MLPDVLRVDVLLAGVVLSAEATGNLSDRACLQKLRGEMTVCVWRNLLQKRFKEFFYEADYNFFSRK